MLFCANTLRERPFLPGGRGRRQRREKKCRRTEKKKKNKKAAQYQINFMDTKRRGGERKPEKGETGGREGERYGGNRGCIPGEMLKSTLLCDGDIYTMMRASYWKKRSLPVYRTGKPAGEF